MHFFQQWVVLNTIFASGVKKVADERQRPETTYNSQGGQHLEAPPLALSGQHGQSANRWRKRGSPVGQTAEGKQGGCRYIYIDAGDRW